MSRPLARLRRTRLAAALLCCTLTCTSGAAGGTGELSFNDSEPSTNLSPTTVADSTPPIPDDQKLKPLGEVKPGDEAKAKAEVAEKSTEKASDGDTDSDSDSDSKDEKDKFVPVADYEKLQERVKDMEKSWGKYQDKVADEADEKKKKPTLKIGGRVHLDQWSFLDSDPGINFLESGDPTLDPEDRWVFRRIRLEMQGDVPGNMLYRIQVDFNNPQTPEYKDVYLGFTELPNNQTLLLGNQKRPIGLDHLNSSRHNVFMERPLAVETFNEDARRIGACMYGYSDDEVVNWRYGAFLLENTSTTGRYAGNFDEAGLYGRLAASPWYDDVSGGRGYLHLGLSGSVNQTDANGTIDAGSNDNEARFRTRPQARSDSRWWDTGRILGAHNYEQIGLESMLNVGSLQITGEYLTNFVQRDALGGFAGDDLLFHGGYIFVNYFLTGEHIPLERVSGTIDRVKPHENFFLVDRCRGGSGYGLGALSLGLRYDYLDLVDSDIQGGVGHTWTASSNWYWTAYSKLQTNLVLGRIDQAGEGRTPIAGLTPDVSGDFAILGMRYMIDF